MNAVSEAGKQVRDAPPEVRERASGMAGLLLGGVLIALSWLLTGALPWPERVYATFLLGALPAALFMARTPDSVPEEATRHGIYATSWAGLWGLAALAAAASLSSGDVSRRLALEWPAGRLVAGWTALLILAGALVVGVWYALGHREGEISRFLLPETTAERAHFAWLAVTAGFAEEVVFRGFLVRAVEAASGSVWVGVAASAIVFGLAHRYQGAGGAVRAGVLGAILSAPLIVTGSIVPAILAHAALDLTAGLWWRDRLFRETLVPPRSSI